MLIEELNYIILGDLGIAGKEYSLVDNELQFSDSGVKLIATSEQIVIYFDESDYQVDDKNQFLSKNNTLKKFDSAFLAIAYLKYLKKCISDARYEVLHAFTHELKEKSIVCASHTTFENTNQGITSYIDMSLNGTTPIDFGISFYVYEDISFELHFYPKPPIPFNATRKVCPKQDLFDITQYVFMSRKMSFDELPIEVSYD